MNEYHRRLSTFGNWPNTAAVRPPLLAKHGFYYTGRDDTVQCYLCQTTLREWLPGDNPLKRHQITNPDCPVATGTDTLNATVLLSHDLRQPFSSAEADHVRDIVPPVVRCSPDERSQQHLRNYSFRRRTFHDWPKRDVVSACSLARAGFYYTGFDDRVRCAFCKREFYDWQPGDVPTEEHRRGVRLCHFVRQNFCSPTQSSASSVRAASDQQRQRADEQVQR